MSLLHLFMGWASLILNIVSQFHLPAIRHLMPPTQPLQNIWESWIKFKAVIIRTPYLWLILQSTGFLNSSTTDIWDQKILLVGRLCWVLQGISNISDLFPLHVRNIYLPPVPLVTTKNVCEHCKMPPPKSLGFQKHRFGSSQNTFLLNIIFFDQITVSGGFWAQNYQLFTEEAFVSPSGTRMKAIKALLMSIFL